MSVMIGIDPHKGSHTATAVDGRERALAEIEVRATKRQTRELLGWAERFPTRRWAVESANGHGYLLAQQLVAAGEHVVDVPSTLAARVRVLDSTRSHKNDPNDARSVASRPCETYRDLLGLSASDVSSPPNRPGDIA